MRREPLKLELGAVYRTPSGRRCYWRPGPPSDEPLTELQFEYLDATQPEGLLLTPLSAQRLLTREGPR